MEANINKIIEECNNCNNIEYIKNIAKQIVLTDPYMLCYFAENVDAVDNPEIMPILEKGIISFADIVHIYEFMFLMVDCNRKYFNLPAFESLIRSCKNPKLMYYCLAFVPGINIELMLESLYNTKCIKYIEKLKDEECGISEYIDWYEYEIKYKEAENYDYFPEVLKPYQNQGMNMLNSVLKTKDPYLYNELADYLEYLRDYKDMYEVDEFLEIIGYAMTRISEPLHHYEYAASITFCDKSMFQQLVIQSGQVKYIYYMYEYVDGIDKRELRDHIGTSGNNKYKTKIGYQAYEYPSQY